MLTIKDVYTQYRCVYPSENKAADSIVKAFKHFLKTSDLVGTVYTDNAPEMLDAIEELGYKHRTSLLTITILPKRLLNGKSVKFWKGRVPTCFRPTCLCHCGHMPPNTRPWLSTLSNN